MKEYVRETGNGVVMVPEHQTQFFEDLHQTVQSQFFDGEPLAYVDAGDDRIEISLPPPEELIEICTLGFKKDCFHVVMLLPALVIGFGEERSRRIEFYYVPPPL